MEGTRARKDALGGSLQLGGLKGSGSIGKQGTPAMFILWDLRSKEEHRSDLRNEADCEPEMYSMPRLYLGQVPAGRPSAQDVRVRSRHHWQVGGIGECVRI